MLPVIIVCLFILYYISKHLVVKSKRKEISKEDGENIIISTEASIFQKSLKFPPDNNRVTISVENVVVYFVCGVM